MKSPLAFIHPEAKVADSVIVEPFAYIDKDVTIGEGTWVGPNSTILSGTTIGKNCKIFPSAVIGAIPQDLKYGGEETFVEIGNNVTIRECVTVHRGTNDRWTTRVGDETLLMAYTHIAHDCIVGKKCVLSNSTTLAGHVVVGDFVTFGGMCAVQQFMRIGESAFVTGNSMVRKDVPPFARVAREPLTYMSVNFVGLQRRNFSSEKINEIKNIYRHIFDKGLNTSQALEVIESRFPASQELTSIVSFIKSSKEGIVRGYFNEKN